MTERRLEKLKAKQVMERDWICKEDDCGHQTNEGAFVLANFIQHWDSSIKLRYNLCMLDSMQCSKMGGNGRIGADDPILFGTTRYTANAHTPLNRSA